MKPVTSWVTLQAATSLYTTSITEADILHDVMLLPVGSRRKWVPGGRRG